MSVRVDFFHPRSEMHQHELLLSRPVPFKKWRGGVNPRSTALNFDGFGLESF